MIEQDLYLNILELFDLIKDEPCFKKYKEIENDLINNKEIKALIDQYNEINEEKAKVEYEPYQQELISKQRAIEANLKDNINYQEYLSLYQECNDYLQTLAQIIFKDIVSVKEDGCHGCKSR